jgi:GLPGLI family protein
MGSIGINLVILENKTKNMKYFSLSVFIALFLVAPAIGQINEGKFTYEITMKTDNPEVEMQLAMMKDSKLEMTFSGNKTKQSVSMGSFITTTTITDSDTGESLTLIESMMGNFATRMNMNDMEQEDDEDMDIEFEFVDETKEILGMKCYKAIFVDDEGGESIFWYTKEITPPAARSQYFQKGIPGMPLSFEINAPEISMIFMATEMQTKLKKKDKEFDFTIPEGFKETSPEELGGFLGQ